MHPWGGLMHVALSGHGLTGLPGRAPWGDLKVYCKMLACCTQAFYNTPSSLPDLWLGRFLMGDNVMLK